MFCENYLLLQMKNIGSIKTHFHTLPFQDCFVFNLITLFLTLFRMGRGGGGQKAFSPVTSTNVELSSKNFLTFSFNPFATLV